jgi:hypothetical protein
MPIRQRFKALSQDPFQVGVLDDAGELHEIELAATQIKVISTCRAQAQVGG